MNDDLTAEIEQLRAADEALLRQALDALTGWIDQPDDSATYDRCMKCAESAIAALRARLGQ